MFMTSIMQQLRVIATAAAAAPEYQATVAKQGGRNLVMCKVSTRRPLTALTSFCSSANSQQLRPAAARRPDAPEHPDVTARKRGRELVVDEVSDQAGFDSMCPASGACLLAVLDGSEAAASRREELLTELKVRCLVSCLLWSGSSTMQASTQLLAAQVLLMSCR